MTLCSKAIVSLLLSVIDTVISLGLIIHCSLLSSSVLFNDELDYWPVALSGYHSEDDCFCLVLGTRGLFISCFNSYRITSFLIREP